MPQPILHVAIAERTLERWAANAHPTPFPIGSATANAFRQGALGPDMGFFPGGEAGRDASQLAHTRDTADIVRSLVARAGTPVERAWAWGWLSHMLADIAIHPLVNDAAERFRDTTTEPVTPLVAHIRVEAGLDAWYYRRLEGVARLRPALDAERAAFIADALADTYGLRLDGDTVAGLHRNITRWFGPWLVLAGVIGRDHERDRDAVRPTFGVLGDAVGRVAGPAHVVTGFLNALPPSFDLVEDTEHAIRDHDAWIDALARSGLDDLEDYSLETGELLAREDLAAA